MADRKTEARPSTARKARDMPAGAFAKPFLEMQKAGLGPVRWLGAAWLEGLGRIGSELTDFVAERIRDDVKTQHEILHCKDPVELQEIQARFVARAIEQYSAESGRIVELSQDIFDRARAQGETQPKD